MGVGEIVQDLLAAGLGEALAGPVEDPAQRVVPVPDVECLDPELEGSST
jgi:hypothetical protein